MLDGPGFHFATGSGHVGFAAEPAKDHTEKRAIHALTHNVGEDRPGRPHQSTGNNQCRVLKGKANTGRGPSGIRIQHGDHNRHIGAADRNNNQHTDHERDEHQNPEQKVTFTERKKDKQEHHDNAEQSIELVLTGKDNGGARNQPLQFCECDN